MGLVVVPGGNVTVSDRRTKGSWNVHVDPFYLDAVPITRTKYAEIVGGPAGESTAGRRPVHTVSWCDAIEFCNALSEFESLTPAYDCIARAEHVEWDMNADGYRLPTEAEWEHACRSGTSGPRYGQLDDIAWYRANSEERAHDVGTKQPNDWGLYDMLGNVWEWCWDVYDHQVYGNYRVLRGGGWFDEHWSCRASVRRRSHPTYRIDDVGLRVARTLSTPAAR